MKRADRLAGGAAALLLLLMVSAAPANAQIAGFMGGSGGDAGGEDMMTQMAPMLEMMKAKMGKKRFAMLMQTMGPMMSQMMQNGNFGGGGFSGGGFGSMGGDIGEHEEVAGVLAGDLAQPRPEHPRRLVLGDARRRHLHGVVAPLGQAQVDEHLAPVRDRVGAHATGPDRSEGAELLHRATGLVEAPCADEQSARRRFAREPRLRLPTPPPAIACA